MIEILGKTSIDFMGWRRYSFALSGLLVLLGIIALIQIGRGSANLGIDFAGGTAVQLKFEKPVSIEKAREILLKSGLAEVELQEFTTDNKLLVRVKAKTTIEEKVAEKVLEAFRKNFPDNPFVVDASTEIGPTIASSCTLPHASNFDSGSPPRSQPSTTSSRCSGSCIFSTRKSLS